jgi:putative inorganic carbon (hco3(-)) transporter
LELRWAVVVVAAIAMLSMSMCFAQIFSDFLLVFLFLCLPLMSFNKWFWPTGYSSTELGLLVYGGIFGLGLLDFLLIGLYLSWFYRIFIERSERLPSLNFIDFALFIFLLLHILSTLGSNDPRLGLDASEYLFKYALLFFYLSRNLKPVHLPWLLAALCFAILIQAGLGEYQHHSGNWVGIALDKGADSTELGYQYVVPGLESETRATGTFYDSHALGDFIAMTIPFMFVPFLHTPKMPSGIRFVFLAETVIAVFALYLSYSRSAWVGGAIALAIGIVLILVVWRESQVAFPLTIILLIGLIALPFAAKYVYDRFENSPAGTITERLGQYQVALTIVRDHPIFGVGPGNYMEAMKRYDTLWLDELPVHNVILWIASETGLLGLGCYLMIVFSGLKRFWRSFSQRRDLAGRIAMAGFIALIAHLLDGLTDPLFREPSVFAMFWIIMSLAVAIPNFPREDSSNSPYVEEPAPA